MSSEGFAFFRWHSLVFLPYEAPGSGPLHRRRLVYHYWQQLESRAAMALDAAREEIPSWLYCERRADESETPV